MYIGIPMLMDKENSTNLPDLLCHSHVFCLIKSKNRHNYRWHSHYNGTHQKHLQLQILMRFCDQWPFYRNIGCAVQQVEKPFAFAYIFNFVSFLIILQVYTLEYRYMCAHFQFCWFAVSVYLCFKVVHIHPLTAYLRWAN